MRTRSVVAALLIFTFQTVSGQMVNDSLRTYAWRLTPHQDVRQSLMAFAKEHHIEAGFIVTAVGSLEQFDIRFANQPNGTRKTGHFEVLSLTGTFSPSSCHLHISVADGTGQTTGGHLMDGNLVYTTLELVVGDLTGLAFDREKDPTYGYPELIVRPRKK